MNITDINVSDTPTGARLCGRVVWNNAALSPERVEFLYEGIPAEAITGGPEALLASMVLPAMAVGEDVRMDVPVSPRLLAGLEKIIRINAEWHHKLHAVRVRVPSREETPATGGEVASVFSGGLDSFYTILRARDDPITLLFTVVGFDLRFENRAFAPSIVSRLRAAADALGRRLVLVDSNAYEIGHKYLVHAEHHGAFLAAVALGLCGVRRCYVPSSWTLWRSLPPSGSHPATDHLWSTERLEFVHDAAEMSRVEKGLAVGGDPILLDHLRVCVRRPDLYNCGRCAKCVATALNLEVAGTLERCATLGPVTAGLIGRTRMGGAYDEVFRELLLYVRDPDMRRAIERSLRRGRWYRAAEPIADIVRRRRLRARISRFASDVLP